MMKTTSPFFLLLIADLAIGKTVTDQPTSQIIFSVKVVSYDNDEGKTADGRCCDQVDRNVCSVVNACDVKITRCAGLSVGDCSIFPKTTYGVVSNSNHFDNSSGILKGENTFETIRSFDVPFPKSPVFIQIKLTDYDYSHVYYDDIGSFTFRMENVTEHYQKSPLPWQTFEGSSTVARVKVLALAMCQKYLYGPTCSVYCKANEVNIKNCNLDGTKICQKGWKGMECDQCDDHYFGDKCDVYCKPTKNYTCSDDGSRICNPHRQGKLCDTCSKDYYGDDCSHFCDNSTDGYICKPDGSRQCRKGWSGRLCDNDFITCKDDLSFKTGVFNQVIQVWLKSYTNYNGTLANGKCCDDKDVQTCPSNQCDTSFNLHGIRGEDVDDCFNFPSQYYPPTSNKDSFFVVRQNDKGEQPSLALTSYILPFSNKPTKFKVSAYDEDGSPEWGEEIATWNFQVDWVDPEYLSNSVKMRKITLSSPTAELTVWVRSMCAKYYTGKSCSTYSEASGNTRGDA